MFHNALQPKHSCRDRIVEHLFVNDMRKQTMIGKNYEEQTHTPKEQLTFQSYEHSIKNLNSSY